MTENESGELIKMPDCDEIHITIKHVSSIEDDFVEPIQNFFKLGYSLEQWNTTFTTLIPKKLK